MSPGRSRPGGGEEQHLDSGGREDHPLPASAADDRSKIWSNGHTRSALVPKISAYWSNCFSISWSYRITITRYPASRNLFLSMTSSATWAPTKCGHRHNRRRYSGCKRSQDLHRNPRDTSGLHRGDAVLFYRGGRGTPVRFQTAGQFEPGATGTVRYSFVLLDAARFWRIISARRISVMRWRLSFR